MAAMATVHKISISLGSEDLEWARKKAEETASSVSAVMSGALRREQQHEARLKLLEWLGTDDITEADREAIRLELRS